MVSPGRYLLGIGTPASITTLGIDPDHGRHEGRAQRFQILGRRIGFFQNLVCLCADRAFEATELVVFPDLQPCPLP